MLDTPVQRKINGYVRAVTYSVNVLSPVFTALYHNLDRNISAVLLEELAKHLTLKYLGYQNFWASLTSGRKGCVALDAIT